MKNSVDTTTIFYNRFTEETEKTGDAELITSYREGKLDISDVIGTLFKRYENMMYRKTQEYNFVNSEERRSLFLESVYKAVERFNFDSTAKFSTFLVMLTRNKFEDERKYLSASTKSRDWYMNLYDAPEDEDGGKVTNFIENIGDNKKELEDVEMVTSISSIGLSNNQYRYCELIFSSNSIPTDGEAAKLLSISRPGIKKIREAVLNKLIENDIIC